MDANGWCARPYCQCALRDGKCEAVEAARQAVLDAAARARVVALNTPR